MTNNRDYLDEVKLVVIKRGKIIRTLFVPRFKAERKLNEIHESDPRATVLVREI